MTTYTELVTQIREYTETDSNVLTDAVCENIILNAQSVSYTHLTLPTNREV